MNAIPQVQRIARARPMSAPVAKPCERDFITVCIRVPKSGSESLTELVRDGFSGRRVFYLPTTWHRDSSFSAFQRYRGWRSRSQNLFSHYRTINLENVYRRIASEARDGDAIDGGHIDFRSVSAHIPRRLKLITLLRAPDVRVLSDYNYARQGYFKKPWFNRFDAGILHKMAARLDFEDYLDFLLDHAELYGNLASTHVGWDGKEDLPVFAKRAIFHAGVLEQRERFTEELSQKLGRPLHFPHINGTKIVTQNAISAKARARMERLYENDFRLHAFVRDAR